MSTGPSAADWNGLRSAVAGEVVLAGSDGYERGHKPPMARFWDIRPEAVVRCRSAEDVAQALALARRWGLEVTTRSGGHCFGGYSSTRGVLLDVGPLNAVSVAADATAFAHRAERFLLKHQVVVAAERADALTSAARDWLRRSWALPHAGGGAYTNFPDADLDPWDAAYHGANLDRLLRVKERYGRP